MNEKELQPTDFSPENSAQAFLELLNMRGIRYFFANSGTDFTSIVDGFARRETEGRTTPRPMIVPHEITMVGMAHGYHLASGDLPALMVHVNVGTANCLGGLMAASRARVPMLFCAGRTPVHECGHPAGRSAFIHWGQECFDQAAVVREFVKWDYELRSPAQLESVLDRALAIAQSEPKGPVYLTLPREVLAALPENWPPAPVFRSDFPTTDPDAGKVERAAEWLAAAEKPMLITTSTGRRPEAVASLVRLAEAAGLAVVSFNPEYMNFPMTHACHQGHNPMPHLPASDLILTADSDVPWYPESMKPSSGARIVQMGIDPLYSRYPLRGFPSDLTLHGDSARVMDALADALVRHPSYDVEKVRRRRRDLESGHRRMVDDLAEITRRAWSQVDGRLDFRLAACSFRKAAGDDAVLVNEYGNYMCDYMGSLPGTYFGTPHAGYLGWGLGAALGVKLACPDRLVAAVVGDGSYVFGVPTAAHWVSAAYALPILVIVNNNGRYEAVRRATRGQHPKGHAARTGRFPLTDLSPAPDYEKIVSASGGYGERVESPDQVEAALERAVRIVRDEKRQVLLNVVCK